MLDSSLRVTHLGHTHINDLVKCLNESFQGYFVEMPTDVVFWQNRFRSSGVNFELSQGVFDGEKLVAFIAHAIGTDDDVPTSFNCGTGVLPAYRGKGLVDEMYAYAIPRLRQQGISRCGLEVIDKNARAIHVYSRIGFKPIRRLKCYQGMVRAEDNVQIRQVGLDALPEVEYYSWDNRLEALTRAGGVFEAFEVFRPEASNTTSGYFVMAPKVGYVAQLESAEDDWAAIFSGIGQLSQTVRINNVAVEREELLDYMAENSIGNTIDQFEMVLPLA